MLLFFAAKLIFPVTDRSLGHSLLRSFVWHTFVLAHCILQYGLMMTRLVLLPRLMETRPGCDS